jgi:DNA-directed RNA polymerase specialized sigma24 family protein
MDQASFDRTLAILDPDRDRAGERYELIRRKLTKFFEWRGCTEPEEYADRTMDRVIRKVGEGAEIHVADAYHFFHGVALNVLREYWKAAQKAPKKPLEDVDLPQTAPDSSDSERRLTCLDGCVRDLPVQQLTLITQYHQDDGGAKIAKRTQLASQLGIPLNALRIRAYRIRGTLEGCISECLKRNESQTPPLNM